MSGEPRPCAKCKGTGFVWKRYGPAIPPDRLTCPRCNGTRVAQGLSEFWTQRVARLGRRFDR